MHVKKSVCSLALLSALLLGSCAGAAKDQPADASARAWEPRTIPLRLTSIPAAITHHTRRTVPHHKTDRPRNTLPLDNLRHLQTPPAP